MAQFHALLIGIDNYLEYPLPNGLYYPRLHGCVRDVTKVYNFLTTRLKCEPERIVRLMAPLDAPNDANAATDWPTYLNMVRAFKQLAVQTHSGDQLYVHFSGHGGRTTTLFPDLKGANGFDEALVPPDIGKPGDPDARYLRDVEIHGLLQPFVDNGVHVTIVLDCCHAGGATRNIGGARKRGIGVVDDSLPLSNSAVGTIAALMARWPKAARTTRNIHSDVAWLFEPKGYTFVAACRASESAFEYPFDGQESNGALTYWLLDTVTQMGPDTTWHTAIDRVAAKIHGQFRMQTPTLQGDGARFVFTTEQRSSRFGVPVLEVNPDARLVRINAGEAHGIEKGTRFEIYATLADADCLEKRQALIATIRVGPTESWAEIVEPPGRPSFQSGAQAVMLTATAVRLKRAVRVAMTDVELRKAVEAAIAQDDTGIINLADDEAGADLLIDLHPDRLTEYVIQDSAGAELPNLRPPLHVHEERALPMLVQRLVHIARYRAVELLDMPDPHMAQKLSLTSDARPVNHPGEKISLTIRNTQEPNQQDVNDAERILNITALVLSSDWSISQLYPSGASPFEPLDPGTSIVLELEAYLPEGVAESVDIIKVFATQSSTNFRWLELPPLDEPILKYATRASSQDPLEQLLLAAFRDRPRSRAVRLTSSPQRERGWTVAHTYIHTVAQRASP